MRNRVVVPLVFFAAACGASQGQPREASAQLSEADTSALVVVRRPTFLGFFRPAMDSVEAAGDGYSEGVAHIEFALEDGIRCLGNGSADAHMIIDSIVRVERAGRIDTIRFPLADSMPYGVYLMAPELSPKLIRAYGPSQVMIATVDATPAFFGLSECRGR